MENLNESTKIAKLLQEVMLLFKNNMSSVMENTGMTIPQMMVMGILGKEKTLKITELSGKLNLSNSTVSGILDRMEKLGMVERLRSEQDRRVVHVSVAPNFVEMHQIFHKRFEENIALTMDQGTPEELNKIYEGLEVLKRLLRSKEVEKNDSKL
ncbi:MarR family transcriptional regulator [Desulfosporosinus sp. Sb-LF]|uniref:MarR family winged helix-turn-helix transcriptional regulator n=1 Tax=Desulfosporosinus sp. Sb-LF TaxID=2560027 RepID=UPI00107F24F4|nr:MarR family transcriptional regulator [Desulfosporosinus sp. Sb-LF]TGE32893.1 MarR family transcriptional regulator [Desulfosporosinus sp. Sb-LF]